MNQTTSHAREYVARVWSRWFELAEYLEAGMGGHQGIVVLRRPK